MLLRHEGSSSGVSEVLCNRIKIHHLGKAVGSMEFKRRGPLAERQFSFIGEAFIGSQDQYGTISKFANVLKEVEGAGGKQNGCGRQTVAVQLQNPVPDCVGISIWRHVNIFVGKLQM